MSGLLLSRVAVLSGPHAGVRDVLVDEGRYAAFAPPGTLRPHLAVEVVDCEGLVLFSAPLDDHVHYREPGPHAFKEGWRNGSLASLAGGATAVVEVQNSPPYCDSPEAVESKRRLAGAASVLDFGFYLTVASGSDPALLEAAAPRCLGVKLFLGSSTGGLGVSDPRMREAAARAALRAGVPLAVHAEEESLFAPDAPSHGERRPPEAEVEAVRRAISLAERTGAALLLFHVSVPESVKLARAARERGVRVSCAVCPHHLLLDSRDERRFPARFKVNPPLRSPSEREELRGLLADGLIDVLQTDHAPHPLAEKALPPDEAPAGLPSAEFFLPLCLTLVGEGLLSLERLERMISHAPRALHRLPPAVPREGAPAVFTLADPAESWTVRRRDVVSRAGWSPYEGVTLSGKVKYVVLDGEIAFAGGFQPVRREARFLTPSKSAAGDAHC